MLSSLPKLSSIFSSQEHLFHQDKTVLCFMKTWHDSYFQVGNHTHCQAAPTGWMEIQDELIVNCATYLGHSHFSLHMHYTDMTKVEKTVNRETGMGTTKHHAAL